MKKQSLFLALALFLAIATPALAVDPTIAQDRQTIRNSAQKMRENLKENREELQKDREQAKLTAAADRLTFARTRLTKTYDVIKKNLTIRFNYLTTTLKNQVQSRIDAQKNAGKNVDAANAKMAEFNADAYTKDLAAFEAKYQEMLASTTPKRHMGELNKLANNVRHDLNAMRKTLMDAFRLAIRAK